MNKGVRLAVGIWDVAYPLALYYAATIILMFIAQNVVGRDAQNYMLCEILASAFTIPVMYCSFYRRDRALQPFVSAFAQKNGKQKETGISGCKVWYRDIATGAGIRRALVIMLTAALIGIGLNNVILMSPLAGMSDGYSEAAAHFYGGTFVLELLGSALLTPVLEELVYRGILYARLKQMVGFVPAMIGASLIFAVMHFNIVQFVYALLLGLVLVLFMEKTGHVYGAVLGHITANAIAVIRTETGILAFTVDKSPLAWGVSFACLILGMTFLFFLTLSDI